MEDAGVDEDILYSHQIKAMLVACLLSLIHSQGNDSGSAVFDTQRRAFELPILYHSCR